MTVQAKAIWGGWVGTALLVGSWLSVAWLSSFSLLIWVGLMGVGALLCVYGAVRGSRWFFVSVAAGFVVTSGLVWVAFTPEQ